MNPVDVLGLQYAIQGVSTYRYVGYVDLLDVLEVL